ncbi:MAG TPA: ABC transporter ATP-binding protein [Blastocatellia bacterium]|nr:ABC transporter ATP-binding protein [Blastocatellia bacterium]
MVSPTASELLIDPTPEPEVRETAVRLENVSIQYRVPRERITSIKEYAIRKLQGNIRHDDFFALRDISLEIRKGESFGFVGRNGAGKSTLLRVISRVIRPGSGRIVVAGRVAPLLELGAGFHPELSGRENVFLNGTLLGFSHREMAQCLDEIIDFSELWDFIDAPLRTYSSGMYVRLGFAVATAICPDILIIDEVLAVGDEQFQKKCLDRISDFKRAGTTILLVSHNAELIRSTCDRAAWLDRGKLRACGEADFIIEQYQDGV